jgi:alpha-tubulin suppressor-like RCC1 family protein
MSYTFRADTEFQGRQSRWVTRFLLSAVLLVVGTAAIVVSGPAAPARAAAFTGFTRVAVGGDFTCARKSDGTVWCWGLNNSGQLGDGTTTNATRPVQVSGITNATQVVAGSVSACALLASQTVKCWGKNDSGQLGNGTTTRSLVPVDVSGLTSVTQLSGNYASMCALRSDNTVRCWGWNVTHQLGDGTTTDRSTPITPSGLGSVAQVSAGVFGACARLVDNTVRCWGAGNNGGLGDGGQTYSTSTKTSPTGLSDVAQISGGPGWGNECAVLTSGTVKCWGLNDNGQIGDGSTDMRLTPVTVSGFATSVVQMDVGFYSPCAALSNGTAMCWGWNGYGQVGNGSTVNPNVPTLVSGLGNVLRVASGYTHSCAVLSGTTVKCWGRNHVGQLGDGTTTSSLTAVTVAAPPVPLTAPGSVTATATPSTAKSVDVSWAAVPNASSYTVRILDSSGASVLGTKSGIAGTSTTITTSTYASMADNTAYRFTVTAIGNATDYVDSAASAQASATTTLVASVPAISSQPAAASRTYGQSVTLSVTATVSDGGTLSYQWLKGGVAVTDATTASLAFASLELSDAGSYSVIVTNTVAGGLPSAITSSGATLTVSKAAQSTVTLTSTSGTFGTPLTLTATGGSGSGAYSYAVTGAGTAGCSISAGALASTAPGTCTVTVTRAASSNYLAASSSATTVTISKMAQAALSVATTAGDLYTGIILSVLGGSGTGSVSTSVSVGSANCSLSSGVVSARAVGTCVLTVTKAADSTYQSESGTFTLSFSKAMPVQGTLSSATTGTVGTGISLNFTGGTGTGAVTYTVSSPGGAGCTITNGVLNATTAGKCTVTITRAGDDTYAAQTTTSEFTFGEAVIAPSMDTTTIPGVVVTTTTLLARAASKGTAAAVTTTTAPTTTTVPANKLVAPTLVNTESAAGAATVAGRTAKAKTSRVNNQLVFTAGGFTVTLAGVNPDGSIIPLTEDGLLEVRRGDMFRLDAQGFAPGSEVDIWMFSKSIHMAHVDVGPNGLVRSTLKVPKSVENGLHHLVMVGVDRAEAEAKFEVGMNVGVPAKQWWYSRVLIVIPITLAVFFGLWLPTTARRRRRRVI